MICEDDYIAEGTPEAVCCGPRVSEPDLDEVARELAERGHTPEVAPPSVEPCPASVPGWSVLLEAQDIVHGERQKAYGHPSLNHARTAALWNAFLESRGFKVSLNAEDVCWLNALQKISRQMNAPKRDNLVDACGYIANIEMMQ